MVDHVNNKKWNAVEHYHRHESDSSEVYGVQGVPHVLIIDTKGRIVFVGHPASRPDLEADFNKLLKGEALTGEGVWVDKPADDTKAPEDGAAETKEEEVEEGFKELDSEKVDTEVR